MDRERKYELQAKHRQRNFLRVAKHLQSHPCSDCGEADILVLEFDHLPGTDKRFDIARAVSASTRSWSAIEAEIAKCEVVCANCHRRRTADRAGFRRALLQRSGTPIHDSDLEPPSRFRVPHGGGARGRHRCECGLCVERRRAYARQSYAARRERRRTVGTPRQEPPATLDDDPQ
ncbi:hypothetical protein GCM10027426_07050 [Microbacterium lacusdiani]